MNSTLRHLSLICLLANAACATVVEGSTQEITVASDPQGAHCFIEQAGDIVGRVTTPGTAQIDKSKNDLVISCSKEGYETAKVKNRADMAITSFGNMAFYQLSFLGNAVDSATGASNKYDSKVFVQLTPAQEPSVFPAPPGMPIRAPLPEAAVAQMSMQPPMPMSAVWTVAAPAMVAPHPATPLPDIATLSPVSPSIHAALNLSEAALKAAQAQQLPHLTYAEASEQASRRPPFE